MEILKKKCSNFEIDGDPLNFLLKIGDPLKTLRRVFPNNNVHPLICQDQENNGFFQNTKHKRINKILT